MVGLLKRLVASLEDSLDLGWGVGRGWYWRVSENGSCEGWWGVRVVGWERSWVGCLGG